MSRRGRVQHGNRVYSVRTSDVKRVEADIAVSWKRIIPSVEGGSGWSDEVVLEPGQYLHIIKEGTPVSWSKAVVRTAQPQK